MYIDSLFPPLLAPVIWERAGNIPALVRLFQAYFTKCGNEIVIRKHLPAVLGIFQKLNASKSNDQYGFVLLSSLFEYLEINQFNQYLPEILRLIFIRLTQKAVGKYIKGFLQCCCVFILKHGTPLLIDVCNSLQPGLFDMVIKSLWLEYINKISGNKERKLCALSTIKLLFETPQMLTTASLFDLWPQVLSKLLALLEAPPEQEAPENEDIAVEQTDYNPAYVPLHYAKRVQLGIYNTLPDNQKQILVGSLNNICRVNPAISMVIQNQLPQEKAILTSYFNLNGITSPF